MLECFFSSGSFLPLLYFQKIILLSELFDLKFESTFHIFVFLTLYSDPFHFILLLADLLMQLIFHLLQFFSVYRHCLFDVSEVRFMLVSRTLMHASVWVHLFF